MRESRWCKSMALAAGHQPIIPSDLRVFEGRLTAFMHVASRHRVSSFGFLEPVPERSKGPIELGRKRMGDKEEDG